MNNSGKTPRPGLHRGITGLTGIAGHPLRPRGSASALEQEYEQLVREKAPRDVLVAARAAIALSSKGLPIPTAYRDILLDHAQQRQKVDKYGN